MYKNKINIISKILIVVFALGYPMFGFGKNKNKIKVHFYEVGQSKAFAVSNVPIDQLPETFEIDTTMHIGDDDWQVSDAQPSHKEEFRKTGSLNLFLRKQEIVHMDPNDILYSLPTISNDFAEVENAKTLENVVVLAEDDWRQFEFLSIQYENEIENDLKGVLDIHKNHKEGIGFKEIYVRKVITKPLLAVSLSLEEVKNHFKVKHEYSGVAFNNAAATIVNGFAFLTRSNWLLWGQVNTNNEIKFINISRTSDSDIGAFSLKIDPFLVENKLYAVDWAGVFWAGPTKHGFSDYEE